jgi:hypothetical protein
MASDDEFRDKVIEALAVLRTQQAMLIERDIKQQEAIDSLVADRNRGRGALWVLVSLGGLIGAVLSNLKSLLGIVSTGG